MHTENALKSALCKNQKLKGWYSPHVPVDVMWYLCRALLEDPVPDLGLNDSVSTTRRRRERDGDAHEINSSGGSEAYPVNTTNLHSEVRSVDVGRRPRGSPQRGTAAISVNAPGTQPVIGGASVS